MKIEHVMNDVEIRRYPTLQQAHHATFGKSSSEKSVLGLVFRILHLEEKTKARVQAEQRVAELLRQPIVGNEDEIRYARTLALASLEEEMGEHEVYRELAKNEYRPASFSEGMSYVSILSAKGIAVDFVFHLGTFLCNERHMEFRLLTRSKGQVELVHFCHRTIDRRYRIVVARKEKR